MPSGLRIYRQFTAVEHLAVDRQTHERLASVAFGTAHVRPHRIADSWDADSEADASAYTGRRRRRFLRDGN